MTKKIYFTHKQTNKQTNNKNKKHKNKKRWISIEKQPQQQHLGEEIVQRKRHSEASAIDLMLCCEAAAAAAELVKGR
jgi:hypothetical protein